MTRLYQKLAKKAIAWGMIVATLFFVASPVMAQVPNDPNYATQAAMWSQIDAPAAWDYSTGTHNVIVAVIDTGLDTWHVDLEQNVWKNPFELPNNGVDDDHNGYVDDSNGWNFADNSSDVRTSVAENATDPEAVRHGTIVAGLIGAVGNNDTDGTGLDWDVSLMPIRSINSAGSGSFSNITKAVNYAIANGADVISMSFEGTSPDPSLKAALYKAYSQGIVIVAAAGNHTPVEDGDLDDDPHYPGCFDSGSTDNWILTVGSVNGFNQYSDFSNYGSCVDLVAPGENAFSTERFAPQFGYTDEFGGPWNGTSFAAPLVAGAAALIKAAHPTWGAQQIIPVIMKSVDSITEQNPGDDGLIGAGILDVGRAMALAAAMDPTPAVYGVTFFHSGNQILRLNATTGIVATIATLPSVQIMGVTTMPAQAVKQSGAAVLLKRGNFYYVQILTANGGFVTEFPVSVKTGTTLKSVHALPGPNQTDLLLETYTARTNQTQLTEVNWQGRTVQSRTVTGSLAGITSSADGNTLATVVLSKNSALITEYTWNTSAQTHYTIPAVQGIEGMALGSFWGSGVQLAMVIDQNNQAVQWVGDVGSGSYQAAALGAVSKKFPWYVLTASDSSDKTLLFRYTKQGGFFPVMTGKNIPFSTVHLPAFSAN